MHGGDIYSNDVEYDFSVNINPLGMPEKSIRAAQSAILFSAHYPDCEGNALRQAIAEWEGVERRNVILGNGAAELLYALCYAIKPKQGLILSPTFSEYEAAVRASGGECRFFGLKEEEEFELNEGILSEIKGETDILFLCNPNNPTGKLISRDLLLAAAKRCEDLGVYLCMDECFLPFLASEKNYTMKHSLEGFPHLIVVRAFTKVFGMPGLRLGYALTANSNLTDRIRRCIQPWNVSVPAQMAGLAALDDTEYLVRTRELIKEEKAYLLGALSKGLAKKIYEGAANYIFFRADKDLAGRLLEQKILIRSCGNYRNLSENYFRIGIRTHEENEELIRRWKTIGNSSPV